MPLNWLIKPFIQRVDSMLKILTYPDPVLRRKSSPIDVVNGEIRRTVDEMLEVMFKDEGVGLAAPQVGISERIIVLDSVEGPMALFNPEIVLRGKEEQTIEEGCLSLPGIRLDVVRPTHIVVRGLNDQGDVTEIEADGLLARVIQHEIDHLDGILIIDRASSLQRTLLRSKLKKLAK